MNLNETAHLLVPHTFGGSSSVSKISQALDICECAKNLMVGIYSVEKRHFLYCNTKLRQILGGGYASFVRDGWDFWYSLIEPSEVKSISNRISSFFGSVQNQNPLTLTYHISNSYGLKICMKHEIQLYQMESQLVAVNYFFDISEKEKIQHCFEASEKLNGSRTTKKKILTISPREKQVLNLIAKGYSSKEIAHMLFISNHTAISHRKNLIEKFQVKNTAHLIHKASQFSTL